MSGRCLLIILLVLCSSAEFRRRDAKAQRVFDTHFAPLRLCVESDAPQSRDLAVEVFQVLDLPVNVQEALLVKTDKAFLVKLSLANSSELKLIGLRYSLAVIDSKNQLQQLTNRTEGFALRPYDTKTFTFKTPISVKPKDGERFVLMVEQVISREAIWEVVKAKDALEAYGRGDFSVMPTVMRVTNAVDARPEEPQPVRFRKY